MLYVMTVVAIVFFPIYGLFAGVSTQKAVSVEIVLDDTPLAVDCPVSVPFDYGGSAVAWLLVPEKKNGDNGEAVSLPAQKSGDRLWWIKPAGSSGTRKYLATPAVASESAMNCLHDIKNNAYTVTDNDKPVLRYNFGEVPKPEEVKLFKFEDGRPYGGTRGDYIHPIYGPHGEILTDDFPEDHPHHRGLWWSWPVTRWNSRVEDIWAICDVRSYPVKSRVEFSPSPVDLSYSYPVTPRVEIGPVMVVIEAESVWRFAPRTPQTGNPLPEDSDQPFVRENAVIRVFAARDANRFVDTEITLTALQDGVAIGGRPGAGYGGITLRTAKANQLNVSCLPNAEGNITEPVTSGGEPVGYSWIDATGDFISPDASPNGETRLGMTLFQKSVTSEQPLNRHLYPPIFCFMNAFPGDCEFELAREKPLLLTSRLWIHPGETTPEVIRQLGQMQMSEGQSEISGK